MADLIFEDPRLVAIYDVFDGQRTDLDPYVSMVTELRAKSVLDLGCGTGCFARLLGSLGIEVTALEPARASLDYARSQPNANFVRWIVGDATNIPPRVIDVAFMTGNVAQVFLSDQAWNEALLCIHKALRPGGHLVFEVRDPVKTAWLDWTREKTHTSLDIPEIGRVTSWCEVTDVSKELVSFRWTYVFESGGEVIISDSTLRFRERKAIEQSLMKAGYLICEVREAPDRPGKEFVFIARTN